MGTAVYSLMSQYMPINIGIVKVFHSRTYKIAIFRTPELQKNMHVAFSFDPTCCARIAAMVYKGPLLKGFTILRKQMCN